MEIWHNPKCSKSRAAKAALDEAGVDYRVRLYLEQAPTQAELKALLAKLALEPWDITRTKEPVAKELGLADLPRDAAHRKDWLAALVKHPQLLQRPILVAGDSATVARDPDAIATAIAAARDAT